MNVIEKNLPLLKQIMTLLEKHYGPTCEIVLHDLTQDYNSTIVDIRNGHVTNREIGGCGSNLGLEVLRGTVLDGDRFNYITTTQSGKILRSSSIYLRDEKDNVVGSVCLNLDITSTLQFENYLKQVNQFEGIHEEEEIFSSDVNNLLENLIKRAQEQVGKLPSEMNKSERIEFIKYLDQKGAFLITKSGEQICELLGISKFTFYNYLDTSRDEPR
ncbi:MAG: transcriptional regulator [Lachnospirales bacterium]